jgi:stage II sporulation protein P
MRVRYNRKIYCLLFIYAAGCIIGAICKVPLLCTDELAVFYATYGQVKSSCLGEAFSHFLMQDTSDHGKYEILDMPQIAKESEIPYAMIMGEKEDGEISDIDIGEEEEIIDSVTSSSAVSYDKLSDFDYLIQNFYQVDNTTTITSAELSAENLLSKDMTLKADGASPQILIYHTHSQEGYADSVEGDSSTSVVGVGEELSRILTEDYGLSVMHHTGEYDVGDRDHAYSNAAPALEKILAENPNIEVVIDLHRDGVGEDTRLVTEIDGKKTAQIMFFNGLSRTTWAGDIDYLYNPYIETNMAFSLQMQLKAAEFFPGFARKIYLKGYRYNMHYCPKTLLVEVGAQTNTVEEAKNAMAPLAMLLNSVLTGET